MMKIRFGDYLLHSFSDICLYLIFATQDLELDEGGFSIIFYLMAIFGVIAVVFIIIKYINKKNI